MTRAERLAFEWHARLGQLLGRLADPLDRLAIHHHRRALAIFEGCAMLIPMMREPPAVARG